MPNKPTGKQNPGPDAERLKIDGDWKDATKRALEAQPPKDDTEEPAGDEPSKGQSEEG